MTDAVVFLRWVVLPGAIGAGLTFSVLWLLARLVWAIQNAIDDHATRETKRC